MTSKSSIIFQLSLLVAAFLCTVVFGEILVFQIAVMPGIAKLDDGNFLRAFQLIDGIIQKNQPVFVFVWIGSVFALVGTCIYGAIAVIVVGDDNDEHDKILSSIELAWLVAATVAWLVCQYTTFAINVPLNNRVKTLDIFRLSGMEQAMERKHFEFAWMKWNLFRAIVMGLVSVCLSSLLLAVD